MSKKSEELRAQVAAQVAAQPKCRGLVCVACGACGAKAADLRACAACGSREGYTPVWAWQ